MKEPGPHVINAHWHVRNMPERSRVVLIRTSVPYASLEILSEHCTQACEWLERIDRPRFTLLCDLRAGPGRNDTGFERAMAPFRRRFLQGFRRTAVLIATPTGRLQIQRLANTDKTAVGTYLSESEAHAYLDRDAPT